MAHPSSFPSRAPAACLADEDSPTFVVGGFESVASTFVDEPTPAVNVKVGAQFGPDLHPLIAVSLRIHGGTFRSYHR
jgi:hypothetical protein